MAAKLGGGGGGGGLIAIAKTLKVSSETHVRIQNNLVEVITR